MPRKNTPVDPADESVVNPQETPETHTDPEMEAFMAESGENAAAPQTEPDVNPEDGQDPGPDPEVAAAGGGEAAPVPGPDGTVDGENETPPEPEKKPRRRKKNDENPGTAGDPSQSDGTPEKVITPASRRRTRANTVISIDETRSVETSADKRNNDLLDLVESMKGKKVLSGTIQGVERSAENPELSYAVIYHGDFKVIIPASEAVEPPADFRDRSPADVMHYMVTKRLGAEVDYIVKGVDKSGIAAASRLEAMASKRKEYYFGTDRDGNNRLYEGLNAEARVVSVIRAGIFVDLFGVETYIPLRELSYQRGVDAAAQFQPGQRVLVKILEIDRADRSNIRVTASVKQATENPYEKALRKYVAGSRYVGTVSMVDTNGVFVSLDGGIDCLCSYPKRGRPPRGSRVTVRIIGINNESNRIWGAITHMTTAR